MNITRDFCSYKVDFEVSIVMEGEFNVLPNENDGKKNCSQKLKESKTRADVATLFFTQTCLNT